MDGHGTQTPTKTEAGTKPENEPGNENRNETALERKHHRVRTSKLLQVMIWLQHKRKYEPGHQHKTEHWQNIAHGAQALAKELLAPNALPQANR